MHDDGILSLCTLTDTSEPGDAPEEKLVVVATAYYSYLKIGVTRRYLASGANQKIDALVRCWYTDDLPDEVEYVVMENGRQYRIAYKDRVIDSEATDLTLERLGDNYDVDEG